MCEYTYNVQDNYRETRSHGHFNAVFSPSLLEEYEKIFKKRDLFVKQSTQSQKIRVHTIEI